MSHKKSPYIFFSYILPSLRNFTFSEEKGDEEKNASLDMLMLKNAELACLEQGASLHVWVSRFHLFY